MRITDRQLLVMLCVLKDSLRYLGGMGGYTSKQLTDLYDQVVNQQSDKLTETEEE